MTQLKKAVEPFGEVNVFPGRGGTVRVRATILMEPHREGSQTGIALDGSGSMSALYGVNTSLLARNKQPYDNQVSPVAQRVCGHLARKLDADGGTTCIYWATGPRGAMIEEVGDFTADEAETHVFGPPRNFGTGTQLLPAVKYFVERFADAPWGFYVFITDGELHDLDAVKDYSQRLARDISAGHRHPVKLVLIGIGPDVNEEQMHELDDLETGTKIDLWDHKLASELRVLQQIFAEVVDENARVAPSGRILDPNGKVVKDFGGAGVPALMEFEISSSADYFTLEVPGQMFHQSLSDQGISPAAELTDEEEEVPLTAVEEEPLVLEEVEPAPAPKPTPKPTPAPTSSSPPSRSFDDMDELPTETSEPLKEVGELTDDGFDFDLEVSGETPPIDLDRDDK